MLKRKENVKVSKRHVLREVEQQFWLKEKKSRSKVWAQKKKRKKDTQPQSFWWLQTEVSDLRISNYEKQGPFIIFMKFWSRSNFDNLDWLTPSDHRYRTFFLKGRPKPQGLVGILKSLESKSCVFFDPRRFKGPQKSEKNNFSKRTNKSVDHKFKSFAIKWPQISI